MKKSQLMMTLLSIAIFLSGAAEELYVLDYIEVALFTKNGSDIIRHSDLQRVGLQGTMPTLEELIFISLVDADARQHKVEPGNDAVDRYIAKIMQDNGLSLSELEDIFQQGGRT